MSVIAVQVGTDGKRPPLCLRLDNSSLPKWFLPSIISSVYATLYETLRR